MRPPLPGPLLIFNDGQPLTRDKLVRAIRQALVSAGVDTAGYTGHSMRIGAATTAALVKLGDSPIKMLRRWESSAYQRYLHTPIAREFLAGLSRRLVSNSQSQVCSRII